MIDKEFYIKLWNGEKANVIPPKTYEFLGWVNTIKNPEEFYFKYGTLEGILEQYKNLTHTCGLMFHIDPKSYGIEKVPVQKSREEIRMDGHYNFFDSNDYPQED